MDRETTLANLLHAQILGDTAALKAAIVAPIRSAARMAAGRSACQDGCVRACNTARTSDLSRRAAI